VGLDDLLDQRQPEPCATNTAGLLVIDPEELAEELGERLRWDAHSAIRHPELDMVALVARSDVDHSALWRKLHCIGEQVHEDLTDAVRISLDRREGLGHLQVQRMGVVDVEQGDGLAQDRPQIHACHLEHLAARLDALEVQKVIDQLGQAEGFAVDDGHELVLSLGGEGPLQ
jgi:hypothetical protein